MLRAENKPGYRYRNSPTRVNSVPCMFIFLFRSFSTLAEPSFLNDVQLENALCISFSFSLQRFRNLQLRIVCFLKLDVRFYLRQGLEQGKPIEGYKSD